MELPVDDYRATESGSMNLGAWGVFKLVTLSPSVDSGGCG